MRAKGDGQRPAQGTEGGTSAGRGSRSPPWVHLMPKSSGHGRRWQPWRQWVGAAGGMASPLPWESGRVTGGCREPSAPAAPHGSLPPPAQPRTRTRRQVWKGFIAKEAQGCQVASIYWLQGPARGGGGDQQRPGRTRCWDKGTFFLAPGPTPLRRLKCSWEPGVAGWGLQRCQPQHPHCSASGSARAALPPPEAGHPLPPTCLRERMGLPKAFGLGGQWAGPDLQGEEGGVRVSMMVRGLAQGGSIFACSPQPEHQANPGSRRKARKPGARFWSC